MIGPLSKSPVHPSSGWSSLSRFSCVYLTFFFACLLVVFQDSTVLVPIVLKTMEVSILTARRGSEVSQVVLVSISPASSCVSTIPGALFTYSFVVSGVYHVTRTRPRPGWLLGFYVNLPLCGS